MRKIQVFLIFILAISSFVASIKMATEMLRVKKLTELAILPSRGSKYAAGKNIFSFN